LFATGSTISANVPVLDRAAAFAGPSVGSILLIQVIALPGAVYLLSDWREWDHVEILLSAYSVWVAVSVVFGVGPAKVAGLWFAAYSLLGVLSYALFRRAVQRGVLSGVEAVALFAFAGAGQAIVALAQFANESNFGFTTLGEGANGWVSLSLLSHDVLIGTYVSGFMAMSFELANFMVLLLPALLAVAVRYWEDIRARVLLVGSAGLAALLVRFSMSDAGRGAMVVALGALLAAFVAMRVSRRRVALAALPLLPVFLRSSVTGGSADIGGADNQGSAEEAVISGEGTSADQPTAVPPESTDPITITIPFFDLSNLGVRLQQYVVGLQLFVNNPLFGVGAANFQLVAMQYSAPYPPGGAYPYPAHSIYVMILAESGVPGLLFYATAAAAVILGGFYYGVQDKGLLQIGIACGLVGTFAYGALDYLQLYSPTAFVPIWCLAGVLAGFSSGVRLPIGRIVGRISP
jgi:hypothetical protein